MRDCKGIKILLAICPFSHRDKDLLTRGLLESETEPRELSAKLVFAVPVSSMLSFWSLPLCWISFVFSFHHIIFIKLSFHSTPPPLSKGRAVVVSARLNLSHGTRDVRGVCNFLGSVSPQQRFEMADQCYSSVTAQSFIGQAKESTTSRCEGGPTPKARPQSVLTSSFYTFVSFSP